MTEDAYKINGTRYRTAYKRNGTRYPRPTPAELDEAGETVLESALAKIAQYDPNGTCIKIGFISDLHRSEEGVYADSGVINDRPSIHLLSRLCDEIPFDAVFCGGDITNARDENADYFRKNMQDVVGDFDDYFPFTNVFATFGNHDKRYSTSRPNNTNEWLYDLYTHLQQDGDGVEYHAIAGRNNYTNFYVDFTKYKLRVIFVHQYDAVDDDSSWYANEDLNTGIEGVHTRMTQLWKNALPTTDKADWVVFAVYHGADTYAGNTNYSNWKFDDLADTLLDYADNGGKGILGAICGHWHTAKDEQLFDHKFNVIHVTNAFATAAQIGLNTAYAFSVIVIDPETWVFHEIRVGRGAREIPFVIYPSENNGLLQNGTVCGNNYAVYFCVYNGNHVRYDRRWNVVTQGNNFTDLSKNSNSAANYNNDWVTGDTTNVLFSVAVGDVLKTEVKFLNDSASSSRRFKIFSPQLVLLNNSSTPAAGNTLTNEITIEEAADITAIGLYYHGQGADSVAPMDFELNIYKNGVKIVRTL